MHPGETFRYMGVVNTMFIPHPCRMRFYFIPCIGKSLETSEEDTPGITIPWWQ